MHVRLFALFAVCAIGCAADAPSTGTDSPDSSENANPLASAKASVVPLAVGNNVSIDLYVGSTHVGFAQVERIAGPKPYQLTVCAFRDNPGGTVTAEVDPGSGVLQQFINTPDDLECKVADLTSVRKFRAWFWHVTPPPGGGVAIGLGLSRNEPTFSHPPIGSATIGYPGGVADIHVCAVSGFGTMNGEIDPGSGQLALYQATNGCTDHNPGNSLRKFRAWFWTLPPPL
jgi:hypothetical protein